MQNTAADNLLKERRLEMHRTPLQQRLEVHLDRGARVRQFVRLQNLRVKDAEGANHLLLVSSLQHDLSTPAGEEGGVCIAAANSC
jgi:hypothetical protein